MPTVMRSLAIVFALVSFTPVAHAQDADEQGRIHFQAGTNYFQVADSDILTAPAGSVNYHEAADARA